MNIVLWTGWLMACLVGWSLGGSVGLAIWWIGLWLVDGLTGWWIGCLVDWSVGGCVVGGLFGYFAAWLVGWIGVFVNWSVVG